MIESDCKQFCITKRDDLYKPMAKVGNRWVGYEQVATADEAKAFIGEIKWS